MTYSLTVSSQGQIIIPSDLRRYLGVKPGSQITLRPTWSGQIPTATIEPPISWVQRIKGQAKGVYGSPGEEYIETERQSWNK